MQNVLLWTKIVQENEKWWVDYQEGRFFFHLMVSVTVGDTCGLTSTKHTHTQKSVGASYSYYTNFLLSQNTQTAKSSQCGWQDADGLQPNMR